MINTYPSLTLDAVSNILFNMDPMGTCCVENDLKDEYQKEALHIYGFMTRLSGLKIGDVEEMIRGCFEFHFWRECLSPQQIKEIAHEIFKLTRVHQRP